LLRSQFVASLREVGLYQVPAERQSQLTIKGTQGFQVTIGRSRGHVELTASNRNSAAIYIVRPVKVPGNRIEAKFPGLGRITWLKGQREAFVFGVLLLGMALVDCGLQTRPPAVVVGASVYGPEKMQRALNRFGSETPTASWVVN
jgi:hypothetical protein